MLKVTLTCGHSFQTGVLTKEEKETKSTVCPICGYKIVGIVKAVKLKHPPNSKKWIEGRRVI